MRTPILSMDGHPPDPLPLPLNGTTHFRVVGAGYIVHLRVVRVSAAGGSKWTYGA